MSDEWLNQSQFAAADGCDEKQVRRGIAKGALAVRADGKLHASQVQSGWRRMRVNSRAAPAAPQADVRMDVRSGANVRSDVRTPEPVARMRRGDLVERLHGLDWAGGFDWSEAAVRARVTGAARAVGLEAARSDLVDDGHWGGWQLRNLALVERHGGLCHDAIVGGHGFQLDEFEALAECRLRLDHPTDQQADLDEAVDMQVEQLPLLAYPFSRTHQRPASEADERAWYAGLAKRLDRS